MRMRKSSQSKPIPLLTTRPAEDEEEEEEPSSSSKRKLQMVTTSPFKLPDGWSVQEKRRPLSNSCNPGQIDRYYYEPDTGLKFRSLAAVQRYQTEGQIDTRTIRSKPGSECTIQNTPSTNRNTSSFLLPDDWEIEEKRRYNSAAVDKTYIEPGTGQRFRSLRAAERYLTGANEYTSLKPLLSPGSGRQKMKSSGDIQYQKVVSSSAKINISGENDRPSMLNFGIPPAKVNWVLGGTGGSMWNPFMEDSKVPDSVKQKWSETFVSAIYGGNISAPSF
ncbi:PREDICTED: methyl-CpG-binding domain-containing protein 7 isoform X2 [Prunus mume]|uniref:Methyl-CpG-binding domain-containing protein 7 isoform X2 n=1 Tax=Prunus mume TaxID=102107 RepID=A0ABM0NCY7_PRUMU|nr:PREDICTED: methyl-CpG-binding domain-containing protein 7 isoform X2 [Prunus mume]